LNKEIYPIFDQLVSRQEREQQLNQIAKVFWMSGLSGSGKSTVAKAFERKLFQHGFFAQMLDGDNIRSGINKDLSFSQEDREENIRRISEIAKLYLNSGIVTIVSFISPTIKIRELAKSIIGPENFIDVFVNTPIEVCEQRDVKGLYAKARKGEIKDFTGINGIWEEPENPDILIPTHEMEIHESVSTLYTFAKPLISNK